MDLLYRLLVACVVLLALGACDSYTVVEGRVVDATGKPISGAVVALTHANLSQATRSDSLGRFNLRLPFPWGSTGDGVTALIEYWAGRVVIHDLELVLRTDPRVDTEALPVTSNVSCS